LNFAETSLAELGLAHLSLAHLSAIGIAIVVALQVVIIWIGLRGRNVTARQTAARLSQQFEEAGRVAQIHSANTERALDRVETHFARELARLRETLERRLGENQAQSIAANAALREKLDERLESAHHRLIEQLTRAHAQSLGALAALREQSTTLLGTHQTRFEQRQSEALSALQTSLNAGLLTMQRQIGAYLERSNSQLSQRVEELTRRTDSRLQEISLQVEKRLADGFNKTTATFADVVKRLALIDDAQKKITELSGNVVSLQEVLADKRSRGAFGEVQLNALVRNMLPEQSFSLQHTLTNGRVADCMLFLPAPTGHIVIDSKFPLESYQRMHTREATARDRELAQRAFKTDIRKHISDIAERYIVAGETTDGAVMFLPAEAVFAEIQAHHPDLVQLAHDARVWMASPTTLMAILNTCRAVLKDEATRAQVNVIQTHLGALGKDFQRFQLRMDNLAKHIKQAGKDVEDVHVSARKITSRFGRIERVDLSEEELEPEPQSEPAISAPAQAGPPPERTP
jgi:DNA recombination protein RmuC